ncbi:hypothetical protein [Pseudonocardia xishanensis]|uniref:Uncharacterized protein n=1 Tax=Pseudonocardia xishanensis TaxID=630995 RepID=A0ABP8RCK3_9PSEU
MTSSPEAFVAKVRKAAKAGPYTVERTPDGFVLTAEVVGPPRARGRRHRERLTHAVVLAEGTYRVTDTRETLDEAPEQGGSLLRLDRRAEAPVDPAVEAHRMLTGIAAELGWAPARAAVSPHLVLGIIAAFCLVVLVVALLLVL